VTIAPWPKGGETVTTGAEPAAAAASANRERTVLGVWLFGAEPSASLQHELDTFGVTQLIGPDHVYATVRDARDAFQKNR
jgi:hypothetical protein